VIKPKLTIGKMFGWRDWLWIGQCRYGHLHFLGSVQATSINGALYLLSRHIGVETRIGACPVEPHKL
jgi:hypothetical protein